MQVGVATNYLLLRGTEVPHFQVERRLRMYVHSECIACVESVKSRHFSTHHTNTVHSVVLDRTFC